MDFDPDAFIAAQSQSTAPVQAPTQTQSDLSGFDPDAFISDIQQEKYGGIGQQALAGVEGIAQGVAGPLATGLERAIGVKPEDIRGREEANPITSTAAKGLGLAGSLLTGFGEGAVLTKAGEVAAGITEAGQAANAAREMATAAGATGKVAAEAADKAFSAAPYLSKVGSSAVQQAAEMAVLQGGDEISKMILQDPETSAESAISNIGMAAVLGGAGGALITGVVSPIWQATAGPKLGSMLNGLKDHLNGATAVMPEEIEKAATELGIEVPTHMKPVLSGNPGAIDRFNVLKEVQNREVLEGIDTLKRDVSNAVLKKMDIEPSSIHEYSENEAGHKLLETFKKEYKEKYEPIATKLQERDAKASTISIPDEDRLQAYGKLLENGMNTVQTDSPYYKLYEEYGQRLLARDTVGSIDKLKTEIDNRIKGLNVGGDRNIINSLLDIKSSLADLQENQIAKQETKAQIALEGRNAKMGLAAPDKAENIFNGVINDRAATNRMYREFAKMSDELTNHLNIGDFHGYGSLGSKLTDKLTPEQLLKKFSFRNNADFIGFLEQHFPETLKEVKGNELKSFLKPAILSAKGEEELNVKKLSDILSKAMAGKKEYIEAILPKEGIQAVEHANKILEGIPNPKSSGTAGWLTKVTKHLPQSALSAVAMLTGHNPVFGYLAGEAAEHLGRSIPDAVNLGYLKFLGSNQAVKSEGFKSMVDLFTNIYKGQHKLTEGVKAVFDAGSKVALTKLIPSHKDTEKLDKIVDKIEKNPSKVFAQADSHTGHYLPDHQAGMAEASTRAIQYLQSIKPKATKASPLGKEIEPTKAEMARYQRALEIAQSPAIVLKHISDGTLRTTDIQDLGAMYPGLAKDMASKLSNTMMAHDGSIPYKTRISLSLFLGQPLDSTMTPEAIQATQRVFAPKPMIQQGQPKQHKPSPSKMNKTAQSYQTPLQSAEQDKLK